MDYFDIDMMERKHGCPNVMTSDARQDERGAAPKLRLVEFLESVRISDLDITREKDTGREVDL